MLLRTVGGRSELLSSQCCLELSGNLSFLSSSDPFLVGFVLCYLCFCVCYCPKYVCICTSSGCCPQRLILLCQGWRLLPSTYWGFMFRFLAEFPLQGRNDWYSFVSRLFHTSSVFRDTPFLREQTLTNIKVRTSLLVLRVSEFVVDRMHAYVVPMHIYIDIEI